MTTNFPSSIDAFTNPTSADTLDNPPHDQQHADINDAMEAVQAKVGVDGSADTGSLDYKVAQQGLVLIKEQDIQTSPYVSSVTVTNVFSSTFRDYMAVVSGSQCSVYATPFYCRYGSGGTYYGSYFDGSTTTTFSASSEGLVVGNTGAGAPIVGMKIMFGCPNLAQRSTIQGHSLNGMWYGAGQDLDTTQQTDFTLRLASGVFFGGNIRVYGFNNG